MNQVFEWKGGFFLHFETFALMKKNLEDTFGSGAKIIVAIMAKPCGRKICREIVQEAKSKEEALNQFCVIVKEQNWADLSFFDVDFDKGSGKAIGKKSFESRSSFCLSGAPRCNFLANFIAGFIAELFAKDVTVREAKCRGNGHEHCEFRF